MVNRIISLLLAVFLITASIGIASSSGSERSDRAIETLDFDNYSGPKTIWFVGQFVEGEEDNFYGLFLEDATANSTRARVVFPSEVVFSDYLFSEDEERSKEWKKVPRNIKCYIDQAIPQCSCGIDREAVPVFILDQQVGTFILSDGEYVLAMAFEEEGSDELAQKEYSDYIIREYHTFGGYDGVTVLYKDAEKREKVQDSKAKSKTLAKRMFSFAEELQYKGFLSRNSLNTLISKIREDERAGVRLSYI